MIRNKVFGSDIREFESLFSNYFDNANVKCVSSASIGILGVFFALGLSNSEIITTPLTWAGAISPLKMLQINIVYGDIEEPSLTLNPDTLEQYITPNTKAVFSADFLGYSCRLDEIKKICNKHNLLLIHDSASSLGSSYNGKYSGSYADVSIFSFGRLKPFTTGEGGAIVTHNSDLYSKIIEFTAHPERQDIELGLNNPFAFNTSLNPLAVKYGLDTFESQMKSIEAHRTLVEEFLLSHPDLAICPLPHYQPNFYKPIFNYINIKKYGLNFNWLDLPFLPLDDGKVDTDLFVSYKIPLELCPSYT